MSYLTIVVLFKDETRTTTISTFSTDTVLKLMCNLRKHRFPGFHADWFFYIKDKKLDEKALLADIGLGSFSSLEARRHVYSPEAVARAYLPLECLLKN